MHGRIFNLVTEIGDADNYAMLDDEVSEAFGHSVDWAEEITENLDMFTDAINWCFGEQKRSFKDAYQLSKEDINHAIGAYKEGVRHRFEKFKSEVEKVEAWLSSDDNDLAVDTFDINLFDPYYGFKFIVDGWVVEPCNIPSMITKGLFITQVFDYHF